MVFLEPYRLTRAKKIRIKPAKTMVVNTAWDNPCVFKVSVQLAKQIDAKSFLLVKLLLYVIVYEVPKAFSYF